MDLTSYVESIRQDLITAAEVAGEDARAAAERMTASLDAAVRLALIDALSTATEEITRELAPGSVELRMRGRDPHFVVTAPPAAEPLGPPSAPPPPPPPPPAGDGDFDQGITRITLRMMEGLKGQLEAAAIAEGLSLNAYLNRAINDVLRGTQTAPSPGSQSGQRGRRGPGQHLSGWAR